MVPRMAWSVRASTSARCSRASSSMPSMLDSVESQSKTTELKRRGSFTPSSTSLFLPTMDAATCRSRYVAASALLLIALLILSPALLFAQRDLAVLHDSLQRIDDRTLLR